MIEPFLPGLPPYLVELMMREYDSKCRGLAHWRAVSKSPRLRPYLENESALQGVIAIGIYYRYVVGPLTSAGDFVHRLASVHGVGLQVAGKTVSPDLYRKLEAGRLAFKRMAKALDLDEGFFSISDLRQIVMGLARMEEQRRDGES